MDLITDVPLLLEKSDEMIRSKSEDPEHCRSLLTSCQKIVNWQQWCKLGSASPLYWAVPTRAQNPSDDGFATQLFPFALEYECLHVAMLFVFSSAVMLQLLSAALMLHQQRDGLPEDNISQQSSPHALDETHLKAQENTYFMSQFVGPETWSLSQIRSEADRTARFLCQSTEYCFRRDMGTVGTQAMCHPQYILRSYFRQVGLVRELDWWRNIKNMKGPDLSRGIEMMMFGNEEHVF
jgi:hypothetical protein